jgi:hypothetical protein
MRSPPQQLQNKMLTCCCLTVDSPGFLEAVHQTGFADVGQSDDSNVDRRFDVLVVTETGQDRH